jgi:long-subunit fatty acid transport protein
MDTMRKAVLKTKDGITCALASIALAAGFAGLAAHAANAQEGSGGELVALGKKTGVGARAISLGEAFTAVADDYSALYYNSAGMTQLSRSEMALNLAYGYAENLASVNGAPGSKSTMENTKLNSLSLVLTDRGRWALGLGYYSPISFDDPVQYTARGQAYAWNAEGQMDHYRLALAYKVSEQVSLGLAASAISGWEELEIRDGITSRYLEEYTGFNLEPSVLFHLSDHFSLGASAVVSERLELVDTYQQQGGQPIENRYDIRHPFQTRLGIAFQSGLTQVSADWHGDFWSSYEYSNAGAAFKARDLSYPNRHSFNLGLEQHLSRRGPVLRAGYSWENHDDRTPQPEKREPYRLNLGLGLIPAKNIAVDFAYQYGGSRTIQSSQAGGGADLDIRQENQQVMGALRYRW